MEMITRMIRISKKLALAAGLTAVVVGLGTGIAVAAGDTDDSISPASTMFKATNLANILFEGKIDGIAVTVTCKISLILGTTPATGLGPVNISNPGFGNCSDSLGGTDTISTNSTNGPWQLTFIESTASGEETQTEPNIGDSLQVTIPKAGATFTSTALGNCVITVAPAGPFNITGTFDDVSTLRFSGAMFPVKGDTCITSSFTITGSYKFTPGFHDIS